jgi:GMP reductase
MRIIDDIKLDFSDVLLRPKRSTLVSRSEVSLEREYTFRNGGKYKGVPIMAANMDGVGEPLMAFTLAKQGLFTVLKKSLNNADTLTHILNTISNDSFSVSMGTSGEEIGKFNTLYKKLEGRLKYVCIDIANGYSRRLADVVEMLRHNYPELIIIAGNVVTAEMVEELLIRGADIVKVGIGSGAVCTTRVKTGVGYPQFSAIVECADAAHGLGGHIIADGGCTCPGDVAKAFGAGADFVMLGSLFAGHLEGGGKIVERDGGEFIEFYGMSSKTANDKHFGGLKDYRSSEGRTVHIPFKGVILDTIQDINGGLRSACTYVGAKSLKHLSKCATFIRVNNTHNRVLENFTTGS